MKGGSGFTKSTLALFLIMISVAPGTGQLIEVKSVPVAEGDQFLVFPAPSMGMGGVSLALEDTVQDVFINPAKGVRIRGLQLFSAPTLYRITKGFGSARTIPVGALYQANQWFGCFSLSVQQQEGGEKSGVRPLDSSYQRAPNSVNNAYLYAMAGAPIRQSGFSLAGSVFRADLQSLQGVEILYPGSQSVEQSGSLLDVRIGILGELNGDRQVEALLLHNRFNMTHQVTYRNWVWDPIKQTNIRQFRIEKNKDHTNTWGLHLGYAQPLGSEGWRLGSIFTINYKWHPGIPNYELMNIPRDPGNTWAYNFGLGLTQQDEESILGFDLIYEPIWSETWAVAQSKVETVNGTVIPVGGRTVENDFRFDNIILRTGLHKKGEIVSLRLGLQWRHIRYRLEQTDFVQQSWRHQVESWTEWSPSVGLSFSFPELQIHYVGRLTAGTGQPGVEGSIPVQSEHTSLVQSGNFIVAPSGNLTLHNALVMTHQISVVVPIRK